MDIKRWCVCVGGRARLLEHLGQGGGTQQQWAGQQGPSIKIKGRECTGGGGGRGGERRTGAGPKNIMGVSHETFTPREERVPRGRCLGVVLCCVSNAG